MGKVNCSVEINSDNFQRILVQMCMWVCVCEEETRASEVGGGCGDVLGIVYRLLTGIDKSTEGER